MEFNIKPTMIESIIQEEFTPDYLITVLDGTKVVKTLPVVTTHKTLMNLTSKLLELFKVLARTEKPLGSVSKVIHTDNSHSFVLNLFRTKNSSFLFEPLTKLGINLHKLILEVKTIEDKIFIKIHDSLFAHITRLDAQYVQQISLYLLGVMRMFTTLNNLKTFNGHFTLSKMSANELRISQEVSDNLNSFLIDLDKEYNISLEEISYDPLKVIQNYTNTYSSISAIATPDSQAISYNIIKQNDKYYILLSTSINNYFNVDVKSNTVNTNFVSLSFLDLDTDSVISSITSSFDKNVPLLATFNKVTDTDKFLFSTGQVELIENIEEISDSETQALIEHFIYEFSKLKNVKENIEVNVLVDFFGKEKVNLENSSFVSLDSIKQQYQDDAYAQQLYSLNQKVIDRLGDIELQELTNFVPALVKGEVYSALFVGESGTGKSTTAKHLFHKAGIPFEIINASTNLEESDLIGTMVANKNRKSDLDPMFVWKDGVIARAVRMGYGAILEEINFARAGILGKLNSLLDDTRQLELGDGTIIQAHPNFKLFATGNIGEEGTQRLNRALINRFQHVKKFKHLNKQETIDLIMAKTNYKVREKVERIYSVYDAIKKYAKENQLRLSLSIRQLLNIFTNPKIYKTAYDAVINCMVNPAFLEEQEHQDNFVEIVLSILDISFKL